MPTEAFYQSTHELRLARAQIAIERDALAALERSREVAGDLLGLRDAVGGVAGQN